MDLVVDILLVACLALTAIAGARNGFFRELFALAGVAGGVVTGLRLTTPILEACPPWLRRSGLAWGLVFTILFVAVSVGLSLLGRVLAASWEGKKPSGLSRLLGFVLGGVRGLALVLFLAGMMVMLAPPDHGPLARSRVLPRLDGGLRAAARFALPPPAREKVIARWDRLPFRGASTPAARAPRPAESI